MELNSLGQEVLEWCKRKGWNRNFDLAEKLVNCHSELSEAWEEIREGYNPNQVYFKLDSKPEGFGVEIADEIIRLMQICAFYGIDIEDLIRIKMEYNQTRPYMHGKIV